MPPANAFPAASAPHQAFDRTGPLHFLLIGLLSSLLLSAPVWAQRPVPRGIIQGEVVDAETLSPLPGANLILLATSLGAVSNADGDFIIPQVPVGTYALEGRFVGYEHQIITDLIVRPDRITPVRVVLKPGTITGGDMTVKAGYFPSQEDHPLSLSSFSFEEIRRAPGAAGDISRILQSLPGLAKVNDQANPLIVRGGSPMENAFFIDGIEVPNINHFPAQGASSGPIGMVQADFIQDARFHAGGFSPSWGDRLSSILDITFREGSRKGVEGQLDLNYAGFGGAMEGPLPASRGSWMAAIRRSYLDLAVRAFDVGSTVAPRYGDYQAKVVWDLHPRHRLSLLTLWGDDHNHPDRETAVANKMLYYGDQNLLQGTTGLAWRALWTSRGFSQTTLSWSMADYKEDFWETNTGLPLMRNRSQEQIATLRNLSQFRLSDRQILAFGIELHTLRNHYNNRYETPASALSVPATVLRSGLDGLKSGLFVQHSIKPADQMTAALGLRIDYFSHTRHRTLSPRASLTWQSDALTRLSLSAGVYRQSLPALLLAQHPENNLSDLRALHFIAGVERLLSPDTRLTVELYDKEYSAFPVATEEPGYFVVDELIYSYGFYTPRKELSSTGRAWSRGIEAMVQKKMAQNIYGLASAAWFRTRYRGGDAIWRDRVYDNRIIVALEGGYKPSHVWEMSLRWIYAGGAPYTSIDAAASSIAHQTILEERRINDARYPAYHSLNIRADRRFIFSHSSLVGYISVWNVYNRKNVAGYFWNETEKKVDTLYQFGLLPVLGLEYEF